MYLFFSDWSRILPTLDKKNIPHGGRIIKAYGATQNPATFLDKPTLTVQEIEDAPFGINERYVFSKRGVFLGPELNLYLDELGVTPKGRRVITALFRFANLEQLELCQGAMTRMRGEDWVFNHPIEIIHGIKKIVQDQNRELKVHLDIFSEQSLKRLKRVVDYDNTEQIATHQEVSRVLKREVER